MGLVSLIPIIAGILMIGILAKTVAPSTIQQIKTTKVDTQIIQTQRVIYEAVCRYITLKGTNPTSLNDLITAGLFQSSSNNNGFGGTYSISIDSTKGTLIVTTDIADASARTAFINSYKNTFKPVQGSGNFVNTTFVFPMSVMHGNGQFMTGIPVQSAAPSASAHKFWYDTSGTEAVLKMSDGATWKSVASASSSSSSTGGASASSLGTIITSGSLATTTGTSGDLKYVYDSATNSIQQYAYYNGGWVLSGGGSSSGTIGVCPSGFVSIPNSEGVDGWAKGWCVQKYLPVPYNTSGWTVSAYNTYTYQDAYQTDTTKNVTSKPGVLPISYVSHNNARAICTNRLVDEYGTQITGAIPMKYSVLVKLLQDLSSVPTNWSGNAAGSGFIYSGHNDGSPAYALAASSLDSDGYYGTGNSSSTGANQKRTLTTSKGDIIWDFAGNLSEQMYEGQNIGGTSIWAEYTATADTNPFDPKFVLGYGWNSTQGVGKTIFDNNIATINSITAINPKHWLIRGGSWGTAASSTGLFTSVWGLASLAYRTDDVSVRCIAKKQ